MTRIQTTPELLLELATAIESRMDANESPAKQLIIPKHHGAKLHDIPDDQLTEILPVAARIARAVGCEDYNILQNNGRIAHQVVDHVR